MATLTDESLKTRRHRRTRADIARLDEALTAIVQEQQPMSVRGAFYQAEVKELVPKDERGYDVVQRRLLVLRRAKVIPYGWITDGTRMVQRRGRWDGLAAFASHAARFYRRDYWATSDVRAEVWIEKDALSGVIYPVVVDEWGLELFVARGFSSETYLHNAGENIAADGRPTFVYVLGDFDPSGQCAAGKIMELLPRFAGDVEVHVEQLAVNFDQIKSLNLPTRAVKMSDSRSPKFVEKYGPISCELDAIPPKQLRSMVGQAIARHADTSAIDQLKMIEKSERQALVGMFREEEDEWGTDPQ